MKQGRDFLYPVRMTVDGESVFENAADTFAEVPVSGTPLPADFRGREIAQFKHAMDRGADARARRNVGSVIIGLQSSEEFSAGTISPSGFGDSSLSGVRPSSEWDAAGRMRDLRMGGAPLMADAS